jgi:hypothetical protein
MTASKLGDLSPMKGGLKFALTLSVAFLTPVGTSRAATVIYGFEPPELNLGEGTPLLGVAPNSGPSSFRADFSCSTGGSFGIGTAPISPSFTGQNLMDFASPADTLTVSVNMPITSVQLDFALFEPGSLVFSSAAGMTTAFTLVNSQGGNLLFNSATGFTSFSLQGFNGNDQATLLAIDNLTMTTVPEPRIACLLLAGLGVAWICRSRFSTSRRGEAST